MLQALACQLPDAKSHIIMDRRYSIVLTVLG